MWVPAEAKESLRSSEARVTGVHELPSVVLRTELRFSGKAANDLNC